MATSVRLISREILRAGETIEPGQTMKIEQEEEHGYFHACGVYSSSKNVRITCDLQMADGSVFQPWSTHDTFVQLLRLGFGLAPGDVALVGGNSPDNAGLPNNAHPFITRWKDSTDTDITGEAEPIYGMAYLPQPPVEYDGSIKIALHNPSDEHAHIHHFYVFRRVYAEYRRR